MNIPDFIPVLKSGNHCAPSEGACFMEMIAFLNGEKHSDKPKCVHPALIPVGINTNDFIEDKNRNRLLDLMGAFMGTENIDISAVKSRVQQEVLPEFYNWFSHSEFQFYATCSLSSFSLTAVGRAIAQSYVEGNDPDMYDNAMIDYCTAVANILKDMKGETETDIEKIAVHPSLTKVNV